MAPDAPRHRATVRRMSTLHDFPIRSIDGPPAFPVRPRGKAVLVVNVASQCGLTPQYSGLEDLQKKYGSRGFTVLGFPCNQFAGQEPGSRGRDPELLLDHLRRDVPAVGQDRGQRRRPRPALRVADRAGTAPDGPGDIKWNFAKFLIGRDGTSCALLADGHADDGPVAGSNCLTSATAATSVARAAARPDGRPTAVDRLATAEGDIVRRDVRQIASAGAQRQDLADLAGFRGHRGDPPRSHDRPDGRRGPRERRRHRRRRREGHRRAGQFHDPPRARPDLHADHRRAHAEARPAHDGPGEHRPARHRLHGLDRREVVHRRRRHRRRPLPHDSAGRRPGRRRRRLRDPRPHLPAAGARGRRAGAHRPDRGIGRPLPPRGPAAGRRHLRDPERRRHDGPPARPRRASPRPTGSRSRPWPT